MIYFDPSAERMIYTGHEATADFWDAHWDQYRDRMRRKRWVSPLNHVVRATSQYLPKGSKILEGGSGLGWHSWSLHLAGFRPTALDYAERTVKLLESDFPELNPILGDVRKLPFPDAAFDGYWSIGVIEHFWDGFDSIGVEASRVIKPGGYLFLTFPQLSDVRKEKSRQGSYPTWDSKVLKTESFYQFALDAKQVSRTFQGWGFEEVESRSFDGIGGYLREGSPGPVQNALKKAYESKNPAAKLFSLAADQFLKDRFGHSALLVLRRR